MTTGDDQGPLRVLLVEDDERLARLTARYLEGHGLGVEIAADGTAGLAAARGGQHDVILLDVMLPGLDGVEVCRELRKVSSVPIIMVTAREEETDRVVGLEVGADDYVAKPFSSRELLARIRAVVRRARGRVGPEARLIRAGRLTLDPGKLETRVDGRVVSLTSSEFAILRALAERPGRVLTREQLLDLARGGAEEAFDRAIDVQISRIRHKLGDDPKQPGIVKTVRGAGYMVAAGDETA